MEADPLEIAREVLRTERTRYYGQPERTDEVLAQALIAKHAEVGRLREALVYLDRILAFSPVSHQLREFARAALAQEAGK